MSKNTTTTSNNKTSFSYDTNNQQDFSQSVNRALDQTKDNINRSIDESKNQIPHYNTIVNSYQEQALQTAREISENYIESQKSIIHSLHSAWGPYQQNFSNVVNSWNSPEAVTNAYSRWVSNVADNAVSALRVTNNMIFSNLDSMKSVLQQAKDNSKHLFNQNVNVAKTIEQNSREVTAAAAAQDANSNVNTNTSYNNSNTTTSSHSSSSNKKI